MKIAQCIYNRLPVKKYGGAQRVVTWLSNALADMVCKIYLLAPKGEVIHIKQGHKIEDLLPLDVDVVHLHFNVEEEFTKPVVVTMHGVTSPEFKHHKNTIFLSRSHAQRYSSGHFVYNGIDPNEYIFSDKKDDYFLFLSKVSRSSKGVDTAIELARKMKFKFIIAGGRKFCLDRNISSLGEVEGEQKAQLLAKARALIFPIRWGEPFGLVTTEALLSGTPVITTRMGAMPEIVTQDVGFMCDSFEEMKSAIQNVDSIDPHKCRERVLEHFTSDIISKKYLDYYHRVVETGSID